MNIDEMPAGRELDALVAEKVMGWTVAVFHQMHCGVPPGGDRLQEAYDVFFGIDAFLGTKVIVPDYSTDIEAAFQVVDKLLDGTRTFSMECWGLGNDHWEAMFKGKLNWEAAQYEQLVWAYAETRPLAICRAALKVMTE